MYPEKLLKSIEFEPSIFPPFPLSLPRPVCKGYEQCHWNACLPFHSRELLTVT